MLVKGGGSCVDLGPPMSGIMFNWPGVSCVVMSASYIGQRVFHFNHELFYIGQRTSCIRQTASCVSQGLLISARRLLCGLKGAFCDDQRYSYIRQMVAMPPLVRSSGGSLPPLPLWGRRH